MLQNYINVFLLLNYVALSIEVGDQWITIPCQAQTEPGVKYRKITWYKVEEGSEVLTGLVLKDLNTNVTVLNKYAECSYEIGENNSLLLPSTAGEACGIYRCTLWPPLGHYIKEGNYEYYSTGCMALKVQYSRTHEAPLKNHLKFLTVPFVLLACAVIFFILNYKMTNKAKEEASVKETLVNTEEI